MNSDNDTEQATGAPESPDGAEASCPHCLKPLALCVCDAVEPIDNNVMLVILQHPQEQDRLLGTARLAARHFKKSLLKIGLSWPSLSKIVGEQVDPQRFAILYLGSVKAAEIAPDRDVVAVDRKGQPEKDQDEALRHLQGVVLLDGTWSQAKALWWRNPWMLKCRRVVLGPRAPSRYGNLRREPRSDGLSTIEAAAMLISRLEHRPEIETALGASFEHMLAKYRDSGIAPKPQKTDWRRKRGRPFGRSRQRDRKPAR
jgi:DTW domain-containing protein YfiP